MTELIKQRTFHDCSICCLAMVAGVTYEAAFEAAGDDFEPEKGMWSYQGSLRRLGFNEDDFQEWHRDYVMSAAFFRDITWGRRALLSVPSLNKIGGWHMVYWDGRELFDPSSRLVYTNWQLLMPDEIIIFQEGIDKAVEAADD